MDNIKTVVFDLYNTLVEIKKTNRFFVKLFKTSQDGFGMNLSSYLQLIMKKDIEQLKNILPNEFSRLYDERLNDLMEELDSIVVYTEVIDVLQSLKDDFRIFMISNLASPYRKPVFSNNLDQYFEEMIFSCDVGFLKPNKEIFKEIEKITGNKPNEILMIGDSFKSDIIGAKNMGWNYLKINRNNIVLKDYEIKSLTEIRKYIIQNFYS
ncbi:conserved protein of unknown function [Tenacibaculum sp. 190524A02b]|uniref:Hydrolase of the HAD superfamily n=1 Tax=Tenacibaculum vairaonense TaxID=3137860 RepID=A0ABP1FIP2_9FLAO